MTVYVDELIRYQKTVKSGNRRYVNRQWCHMTADTLEELHVMAERIGMKRSWFQSHATLWHYDLMASKRSLALKAGAVFKPAREQARERIRVGKKGK